MKYFIIYKTLTFEKIRTKEISISFIEQAKIVTIKFVITVN